VAGASAQDHGNSYRQDTAPIHDGPRRSTSHTQPLEQRKVELGLYKASWGRKELVAESEGDHERTIAAAAKARGQALGNPKLAGQCPNLNLASFALITIFDSDQFILEHPLEMNSQVVRAPSTT
jgi:hypothetical protein